MFPFEGKVNRVHTDSDITKMTQPIVLHSATVIADIFWHRQSKYSIACRSFEHLKMSL